MAATNTTTKNFEFSSASFAFCCCLLDLTFAIVTLFSDELGEMRDER